jgi:hypothetical protein
MAKKKGQSATDEHATSFLGFARQYQRAANLLYKTDKLLKAPTYFLYAHAMELALKAFLRTANIPIVADGKRKHHHITALYEECRDLGLRIGPDDRFDLRNVVVLLEGANEDEGLRYFKTKGSSLPDLSWTRDVVEKLLQTIEPIIKKKAGSDGIRPGVAVKFDLVFSKPTKKA